eukprot:gene12344-14289_t
MSMEEEVDYSFSDCEPSVVNSKVKVQESPPTQKTEMELLREENLRLKELLKLSNREVLPQTEPSLPEPEHANVDENERDDDMKGSTSFANGISHSSKEYALQEQAVNDLHGNAHANASDEPTCLHSEEGAGLTSTLTSAITHIGENVLEAGKKMLDPPVPPLLVDLPSVDPHLPVEPSYAQSSQPTTSADDLNAEANDTNEVEPPSKSHAHFAETDEQTLEPEVSVGPADPAPQPALEELIAQEPPLVLNTRFAENGEDNKQQEDSAGYHSATSATSPPFVVDEALIFRAKVNAARREGVPNVCPDFVHGKCTLGDECPLSHDAVPDTHCPTFNTTGQCYDELCPLLHSLVEYVPAATMIVISSEGQGQGVHSPALEDDGTENSAPAAERELELVQSASAAGAHADQEMRVNGALEQSEVGLIIAKIGVRNDTLVEEAIEPAVVAADLIANTTTSTTTVSSATITAGADSTAQNATSSIATARTITTTINTHPSPAVTYVGSRAPGTSRDTPFDLLLDTYQHHSRSTSPAKTLASTIHSTRPAAVTVVIPPVRSVNVSAKPRVPESKKPEEGEVCEKARTPVVVAKKGKSRFDDDAPTVAAGVTTTTTGSSVATLPLPIPHDGPTTVSTVSSATGGGRPGPGVCYNFRRGDSCRFSHDLDSEPPSTGVCYAFQSGNCDKGDQCRFRHAPPGICFSFQRGLCDRGDGCRFRHDSRPVCVEFQSGSCTRGDSCPRRHDVEVCRAFNRGGCKNGDTCFYKHEREACRNHQRGTCVRGDDCPYSHETGAPNSAGGSDVPPALITHAVPRPNVANDRADGPICFAFMKGTCTFGDDCRFSHKGSIYGVAGVCNLFQRGECTKGDHCRYRHELELCRAFERGSCKNGDRCNYHHPTGTTGTTCTSTTGTTSRYEPWPHDLASKETSTSHYQPPPGKRGRSPSPSPSPRHGPRQRTSVHRSPSRSPSRGRRASRSHEEQRQQRHSSSRERTDSRAQKLAKRDHSPPPGQHRSQHQHSRSPPPLHDPPRDYSDHDYGRGHSTHSAHSTPTSRSTHTPPSDRVARPVTASTTTAAVSHYAGPPPIEEAVFGEADANTQRKARENEKRRSIIDNPCARAYAGKCQLGDRCAFSHDVIPYAYCRLFNNTGCCHKVGCPYIHQLYQYRGVSDSNHSQQGSSRRDRSPSPPVFSRTKGSDRSQYNETSNYVSKPAFTFNKYAPASPSPPRHQQPTQRHSQPRGHGQGHYTESSHKRARSPSSSPSPPPQRHRRSPPRASHSPPHTVASRAYPQHHQQNDNWARGETSGSHYQNRY